MDLIIFETVDFLLVLRILSSFEWPDQTMDGLQFEQRGVAGLFNSSNSLNESPVKGPFNPVVASEGVDGDVQLY